MSLDKDGALKGEGDRREFLQNAIIGISFFFGIILSWASLVTLAPKKKSGEGGVFVPLADEEKAPRRGMREFPYTYKRAGREIVGTLLLVRAAEGLIALSPSCTHLGCFVVWNEEEGMFLCPCHGGKYDMTGRNVEGPPPRPLARFPLVVRDGIIHVKVPA